MLQVGLLAGCGVPAERLLCLVDPPSAAGITRVLGLLSATGPRTLMRAGEPRYHKPGLAGATADELIAAMTACPELIERPVVSWPDRAVIARPRAPPAPARIRSAAGALTRECPGEHPGSHRKSNPYL